MLHSKLVSDDSCHSTFSMWRNRSLLRQGFQRGTILDGVSIWAGGMRSKLEVDDYHVVVESCQYREPLLACLHLKFGILYHPSPHPVWVPYEELRSPIRLGAAGESVFGSAWFWPLAKCVSLVDGHWCCFSFGISKHGYWKLQLRKLQNPVPTQQSKVACCCWESVVASRASQGE